MTKILSLSKVLLLEQYKTVFGKIAPEKKAKSLTVFLLVAALILFSIGANYYSQYLILQASNKGHFILFYAFLNAVIVLLILFTLQIQSSFFEAKDYEILASLPLKNYEIIASKIIAQLTNAYLVSFLLIAPGLYFFFISTTASFLSIFFFVVGFLFFPFLNFFIAALLSYAVNFFSQFFKNSKNAKKALSFIFMLMLSIGLFIITFLFIGDIATTGSIPKVLKYIFPTATLYFNAIAFLNYVSFIGFIALNIALMSLVIIMISKTYFRVNKSSTTIKRRVEKKLDFKKSPVFKNLLKFEAKRFLSTPIYLFNTSLGAIFMLLASVGIPVVFFVFVKRTAFESMLYSRDFMLNIGFIVAIFASLNCTTYASVSIEGSMHSFKKSLPISFEKNMLSKLALNMLLVLPTLLALVVMMPFFILAKLYFYEILLIFVLTLSAQAFIALSGLFSNLMFINISWTNPTTPVKQSVPAFIYALVLMIVIIGVPLLIPLSQKVFSMGVFMMLVILAFVIFSALMWWLIITVGKKKYNKVG